MYDIITFATEVCANRKGIFMKTFKTKEATSDYLLKLRQDLQNKKEAGDAFPCEIPRVDDMIFEIEFATFNMIEDAKEYVVVDGIKAFNDLKAGFYSCEEEDGNDDFKMTKYYKTEQNYWYDEFSVLIVVDTSWLNHKS